MLTHKVVITFLVLLFLGSLKTDTCCRHCSLAPESKGFLMFSSHSLLVMNLEHPIAVFSFPLSNTFLYFWMVICSWYVNVSVSNHCGQTCGLFLFFDIVIMLNKNNHKLLDIVLRAESILLIETHKLWVFRFSIIDCISPSSCHGIYA